MQDETSSNFADFDLSALADFDLSALADFDLSALADFDLSAKRTERTHNHTDATGTLETENRYSNAKNVDTPCRAYRRA